MPEHPADDLRDGVRYSFAIQVCHIDNFVKDLTMTPHHEYWEFAIAAAVSAMGFSTIFSIPRRLLPVVAVGGIIAVCFRNFVNLGPSNGNIGLDMGLSIGSLAGSALISIIVIKRAIGSIPLTNASPFLALSQWYREF